MKRLRRIIFILFSVVVLALVFYKSVIWGIKLMSYRQEVETPDVKGLHVEEALKVLHSKKLGMIMLDEQFSDDVPSGKIINQFPGPGTTLKIERNVRVIVSRGKELIKVPDISGRTAKGSELTLSSFGLRLGELSHVSSEDVKADHVIAQNPAPQWETYKGDDVDILISSGSEGRVYVMPDFIGQSLDYAVTLLKSMQVNINRIIYRYNEFFPEDVIINQSPDLGYPVSDSIGVTLTVNKRAGEVKKVPDEFIIVKYVIPKGYKERDLKLVVSYDNIERTVKKGTYPSGFYFKHLVNAPKGAKILIYLDDKLVETIPGE